MTSRIGFIGVGLMGHGMANCLGEKGHALTVMGHRSRAPVDDLVRRGAREATSAAEVAKSCDIVFLCVAGSTQAEPLRALQPAIALARDGFALAEFGVAEINEQLPLLKPYRAFHDEWAKTYTGERRSRSARSSARADLARTLEALAARGTRPALRRHAGRAIVAHLQKLGGSLTLEDIAAVKPAWKEPMTAELSRPRRQHGAAALRGHSSSCSRCASSSAAISRAWSTTGPSTSTRCGARSVSRPASVSRTTIRPRRSSPRSCRTPMWIGWWHACATASRSTVRPSSGRAPRAPRAGQMEHHTTSFSIADRDGNVDLPDPEPRQSVRLGRRRTGHRALPQQFPLLDRSQSGRARTTPAAGSALPICMAPTVSLRDGKPVLALGTPGSYGILQTRGRGGAELITRWPTRSAMAALLGRRGRNASRPSVARRSAEHDLLDRERKRDRRDHVVDQVGRDHGERRDRDARSGCPA